MTDMILRTWIFVVYLFLDEVVGQNQQSVDKKESRQQSKNSNASRKEYCKPTPADIYGPYYITHSNRLIQYCTGNPRSYYNRTLTVHGHVLGEDCKIIPDTKIEIWQADVNGKYHSKDCRGYIITDKNGYYEFTTVHPGRYSIIQGQTYTRPRHIHFKVHGGLDHMGVVTQMYFKGDPYLGMNDGCRGCSSGKDQLQTRPELFCDNNLCIITVKFDIVLQTKPHGQHSRDMFNVLNRKK
ncbi:protocatechuate 3,4-dioxygenase beta chain-like [Saccostrea echinata]|uniref:protocatechuate 3,4-dioxygenase beta chain-like n=1 Tax=Saccostrea echinata TaxID=191078 RepID=UPI002A83886B|nr:protocatechuate 3,4-dioxygenase beta chain-like [Saccostrea echinata]